jgi:class 3 adenylate cyclase
MPIFKPDPSEYFVKQIGEKRVRLLKTSSSDEFTASLLGLGDLSQEAKATDAIAAVFDLQGFTTFCGQIEPHLSVPLFLREFLPWLMKKIKKEAIQKTHPDGVRLFNALPFFVKFLGDGLLVLWDSGGMTDTARRNVVVSMRNICGAYKADLLPRLRRVVVDPPGALRCGLARGTVYSVGDGNDFVGSCINMAARLQKLPGLSFAFNRRGFEIEGWSDFQTSMLIRKVPIRGIGDGELVGILKREFTSLPASEQKSYPTP